MVFVCAYFITNFKKHTCLRNEKKKKASIDLELYKTDYEPWPAYWVLNRSGKILTTLMLSFEYSVWYG
jgi:hypothetical protein